MKDAPPAPRKRQARRIATEANLVRAVGAVLRRDGMDGLGVNAVAAEAGVDKKLIYRYFGGLPGLLRAYGETADFWPTLDELLGPDREVLRSPDAATLATEVVVRHGRALRKRPLTLELLAWEQVHRNALTAVLEDVRQVQSQAMIVEMVAAGWRPPRDALLVANLFSAAMNYLAVRGREIVKFGDLDLDDDGWTEMEGAIGRTFAALLAETDPAPGG